MFESEQELQSAVAEIVDHLSEMPDEKPSERRRHLLALLFLLRRLRIRLGDLVRRDMYNAAQEAQVRTGKNVLTTAELALHAESGSKAAMQYLDKALQTVTGLAYSLQTGNAEQLLVRRFGRYESKTDLRKQMRTRLFDILTTSGRSVRFDPAKYSELVMQYESAKVDSEVVKEVAKRSGTDLVQVSGEDAKYGDYCDEYKGLVYSISGTHPKYPPLSSTPRGGPPFHSRCVHSISPFYEES